MPKKRRGPGKPFTKGDPRIRHNTLPKEVKESRGIAFIAFNVIAGELLNKPYSEIIIISKDDNQPAFVRLIAAAIIYGVSGSQSSINAIWERIYGRTPETIKFEGITGPDLSKIPLDKLKQIDAIYESVKNKDNAD